MSAWRIARATLTGTDGCLPTDACGSSPDGRTAKLLRMGRRVTQSEVRRRVSMRTDRFWRRTTTRQVRSMATRSYRSGKRHLATAPRLEG